MSCRSRARLGAVSTASFVARLDALPLNRFHWRLLVTSGLGWMFDAMDVILVAFLLRPIGVEFALDPQRAGILGAATPAGMFLGAALSGRLADRYGRKAIFQITLIVFSGFSVLYLGEKLRWNYLIAFGFMVGAVFFMFKK